MAPKKTKARESSSQPLSDSSTHTRKNAKKRRHSDASNVSDRPSSSQSLATPSVPKRRKRTRATPEPEVIEEEDEAVTATNDDIGALPACDGEADGMAEVLQSSQAKHVHFGQASAGAQEKDVSDDDLERTTATHITPHPRKMTIKRRTTNSPTVRSADGSKRVKVTTSRTSLPASLFQDGQDPFYILEERQFAPLREVLQERIRRRWSLHAGRAENLRELQLELETQSRLGNVERVQELHETISTLFNERKQVVAQGDVAEELDEDMLVLEGEHAVSYPHLPSITQGEQTAAEIKNQKRSTFSADSVALVESQNVHEAWNAERRKFEDAIVALSREANEAKTELQILKIELQALGFSGEDVSVSTVLLSIRESFTRIREGLELAIPGSVPEDVSNQNLIEILLANVQDFTDRLHTQDTELQQRTSLITDLGQQVHGLVDHLAEARIRNDRLEKGWEELDNSNENKARKLGNLEEELVKTEEERDILDEDLKEKTEEVHVLQEETGKLSKSLERLTDSLQKYRDEESRLTELISKMEEEHRVSVANMNREREDTVRELEDQIDNHAQLRNAAELVAEERQTMIIGLELRIETVELERDALQVELEQVKHTTAAEQSAREAAEAELDEKSGEVQDLEGRVDRLEEELTQLNVQLEELRQLNETERAQREAAETELDQRNADLEELNQRLREQGIRANELRQKLFEVQQANEHKVHELETAALERDEQFQVDIAKEVERREAADVLAQQRADAVVTLELRLEKLEIEMRESIAIRDERIEALEEEVIRKGSEVETLRSDLRDAEETYETQMAASTLQRQELEASIVALQLTITQHETVIATMRQEAGRTASLHDSEMDDRNEHIAELNYRIASSQTQIEELETAKSSLERRVEQEAEQMLHIQAEAQDELESLRATIRDKHAKILLVEQKVQETEQSWQDVLTAREEEIRTLTTSSQSTSQTLSLVAADLQALKYKFREYVRRSSGHIALLQEALASARAVMDVECEAAAVDGEQMLAEIAAMAEHSEAMVGFSQQTVSSMQVSSSQTNASQQHSQAAMSKKTRGRKRRVIDSGIGLDPEADAELDGA